MTLLFGETRCQKNLPLCHVLWLQEIKYFPLPHPFFSCPFFFCFPSFFFSNFLSYLSLPVFIFLFFPVFFFCFLFCLLFLFPFLSSFFRFELFYLTLTSLQSKIKVKTCNTAIIGSFSWFILLCAIKNYVRFLDLD